MTFELLEKAQKSFGQLHTNAVHPKTIQTTREQLSAIEHSFDHLEPARDSPIGLQQLRTSLKDSPEDQLRTVENR